MKVEEIKKQYPYLYETHCHTSNSSACSKCSGSELATAAKEAGYAGIIITDHNWGGNTNVSIFHSWEKWIEQFAGGYYEAKKTGDKIGLDVFFAYEAGYRGTEFLIYGLDINWLKKHPEIKKATIEQQFQMVKDASGLVVHAHPYREEWYIPKIRLYEDAVDAVEGVNASHSNSRSNSHNHPIYDDRAIAYAQKNKFRITGGSDQHSTDLLKGGVAFSKKLTSISDFIRGIKEEDYVVTNGEKWYDKYGNLIAEE